MEKLKDELAIITELMQDLQEQMEYGKDDFEDRLGRKKPDMVSIEIEGKSPMGMDKEEDMGDMEEMTMKPDPDESPMMSDMMGEKKSPEDELKKRLMRLRG